MFDFHYNGMDLISPSHRAVVANLPSSIVVLLWIVVVVTSPNIAIVFKHDVISVKTLQLWWSVLMAYMYSTPLLTNYGERQCSCMFQFSSELYKYKGLERSIYAAVCNKQTKTGLLFAQFQEKRFLLACGVVHQKTNDAL
ncbi:hypothetical protein QL285_057027 [Trifolium repens]|nr:hypothetical protein QL285_057027 [Trifolium repens]